MEKQILREFEWSANTLCVPGALHHSQPLLPILAASKTPLFRTTH
ncbi:hypothetical protein OROGR_019148 [Orobanche gracilis]